MVNDMPNGWIESKADLVRHNFEIYDNCAGVMDMRTYHVHSFYEIHMVLHGAVLRYTEDAVTELHPGDVTIYPPGVFHRCINTEEQLLRHDYARLLLYVSADFLRSRDSASLKLTDVLNSFGRPANRHLSLPLEELQSLCRPLQEIVKADQDDDPVCHLLNSAQVTLFLARLIEKILQSGEAVHESEDHSLIPRVLSHINTHLADNLSLDSLAEQFFVSKFYLSHQFKQYTELPLHQYVLTRRMMHAQIMLREGQAPSAVASACGYHEYSSFYKAFMRFTGQNPRDFH